MIGRLTGDAGHFVLADTIDLSKFSQHLEHKGRFVTLTAMGHRRHIGSVGLENDAAERHCRGLQIRSNKGLRQVRLLEGEHAADAQHKTVELEQFTGFNLIAGKAMEHAARQVVTVFLKDSHHLVLGLTTVDHQRQAHLHRPAYLFLEGFQLFLLELTAPLEIKANFTNGDRTHWGRF